MSKALNVWKRLSVITAAHYNEVMYVDEHSNANDPSNDGKTFSWFKYLPQVKKDIQLAKEAKPLATNAPLTTTSKQ